MRRIVCTVVAIVAGGLAVTGAVAAEPAPGTRDGELRVVPGETLQAWDAQRREWVAPEHFWKRYAARRGGLTWGTAKHYPPYKAVEEHDTMVIVLPSGSCLMEFFHGRWRRANDVRRWDDAFNAYGGCPHVFD